MGNMVRSKRAFKSLLMSFVPRDEVVWSFAFRTGVGRKRASSGGSCA